MSVMLRRVFQLCSGDVPRVFRRWSSAVPVCSGNVPVPFLGCSDDVPVVLLGVPVMFQRSFRSVPVETQYYLCCDILLVCWVCYGDVPVMFRPCSKDGPVMFRRCSTRSRKVKYSDPNETW